MAGAHAADDDLNALLEDSEQLERETCGSTEASVERPISVLVRVHANSRKSLADRQLTKNDEIAGVKLLERLGCDTDSFELMRQELQRCNWMVTTTVQSTNVAEWLAHKYADIRDETMKATRKRLNRRSQDSLTNYIHAEWNQKIKALEKIRQGDQFMDNINQSAQKAAAAAEIGANGAAGGPFSASPAASLRTPAAAAAAAAAKNSSHDSASALIHAMVQEIAGDNRRPSSKGFLAKMRGSRASAGHWLYVLSEVFAVDPSDDEHDLERRALFAARWFLEEQKPLTDQKDQKSRSKRSSKRVDLGKVLFRLLRNLRGSLLGAGDRPGTHPSILKDGGDHGQAEVENERRQLVKWIGRALERQNAHIRDREPQGVGDYKNHVARYVQRANYPKNPNLNNTVYALTPQGERTSWRSADANFRDIVGSLLYSGRRNERRPKQLKSDSSSDEFYTEDFLWYQLAFLAGCEDDLKTGSSHPRDKYCFSESLKRFRTAIKGKIQDLDSVGDLCLLSAWLPEAAIDFAARKDETQLAAYAALFLYKRGLLQVVWDVDERPSSGTVFLTSAGSTVGPLGRTSYLRLGALVSLFTKFRSTQEDQRRHQIPFWIQFWKTSEYWTRAAAGRHERFWGDEAAPQMREMYIAGMRFAEKQLQEIIISLIRGNVLTAKQDWLRSIAGATDKDNYFRRMFLFKVSAPGGASAAYGRAGGIGAGVEERYSGLIPIAVACTNAAYEAKSYGLNQQALDLFIKSEWVAEGVDGLLHHIDRHSPSSNRLCPDCVCDNNLARPCLEQLVKKWP
eukprot:INCI17681.4.p1 GENE.INCI17681.4~~INCI17681.4.p1  ORF type:complete len:826 (-),score=146.08 INCI17681.4:514-2895(-)